jgi:cytoskeletal protein RodZ
VRYFLNPEQKSDASDFEAQIKICGDILAQARTQKGLSVNDLARQLMLSNSQARALEEGSLRSFHNIFFYKKALKKYQNFCNIVFSPEIEAEISSSNTPSVTHVSHHSIDMKPTAFSVQSRFDFLNKKTKLLALALIVLVILSVGIFSLMPSSDTNVTTQATQTEKNAGETSAQASLTAQVDASLLRAPSQPPGNNSTPPLTIVSPPIDTKINNKPGSTVNGLTTLQTIANKAPQAPSNTTLTPNKIPDTVQSQTASNQPVMLSITFTQDCWLKAVTKDGKTIAKVFTSGSSFEEPLSEIVSLVLGNPSGVNAKVGNQATDLNQFKTNNSSVLRLTEQDLSKLK